MNNIDSLYETARCLTETELFDALYHDPLTGALNRRAFETLYFDEDQLLAIVDMDSLKWVNDNLGHREGDRYLKQLADILQEHFGEDSVFRLGGDEFVIVDPSLGDLLRTCGIYLDLPVYCTYGVGRGLADADAGLRDWKARRESWGWRAPRGERPPWL